MSTLDLRNEQGWCDRCNESIDGCYCYQLMSWENDTLLEEGDIELLDRLLGWGIQLGFEGTPPRLDGPVLDVLPIRLAKELATYFLRVASFDAEGYQDGEDMIGDLGDADSPNRKSAYVVLAEEAAENIQEKTIRTDGILGGVYEVVEVENPDQTRKRMNAILAQAIEAMESLQCTPANGSA